MVVVGGEIQGDLGGCRISWKLGMVLGDQDHLHGLWEAQAIWVRYKRYLKKIAYCGTSGVSWYLGCALWYFEVYVS